jgi:(p)ppGpp synthase/HD superfamily hydrolase
MSMEPTLHEQLDRALAIAAAAHRGQVDKVGKPYILHVLRVVVACSTPGAQIVAALHDVLEDTPYQLTPEEFSPDILEAVAALTHATGTYTDYIERIAANALATEVKLADLRDNLERLDSLDAASRAKLEPRYLAALHRLTGRREGREA